MVSRQYPTWVDRIPQHHREAILSIRDEYRAGTLDLSARVIARQFVEDLASEGIEVVGCETVRQWLAK